VEGGGKEDGAVLEKAIMDETTRAGEGIESV
jgi:hypothetical protein